VAQGMNAGEAVVELLRPKGVSKNFGIVGSSFLYVLDPLYDRTDIEFVGVGHEQGAVLMADGYSRISGAPCIIEIPTDLDEMPRPARLAEVQSPQGG